MTAKFERTILIGLDSEIEAMLYGGGIEITEFNLGLHAPLVVLTCIRSMVDELEYRRLTDALRKKNCIFITVAIPEEMLPAFAAICSNVEGTAESHKRLDQGIYVQSRGRHHNYLIRYLHQAVGGQLLLNQKVADELARQKGILETRPAAARMKEPRPPREGPDRTKEGKRIREAGRFESIPRRIKQRETAKTCQSCGARYTGKICPNSKKIPGHKESR